MDGAAWWPGPPVPRGRSGRRPPYARWERRLVRESCTGCAAVCGPGRLPGL